jgi:hypothetical protein
MPKPTKELLSSPQALNRISLSRPGLVADAETQVQRLIKCSGGQSLCINTAI